MSSVKLNYSAAKEAAEKLFNSVSKIGESMEKLDRALNRIVLEDTELTWAKRLLEQWENYYSSDIPAAMEEIKNSASSIVSAAEAYKAYNEETNN